jgi:hypothetical protein
MPRKVDFHTEWAMPDPSDCEDVESDRRNSGAPMVEAPDMESGQAMQAAQVPKPQTGEKWFVTGGPAY